MKTQNLLITGANGQLGNEMRRILRGNTDFNAFFTDVAELDITDSKAVADFVDIHDINIIVNCAAYTAVDSAEDNAEICDKINHIAVANLAHAAANAGARMIHISTDYVFDGTSCIPYVESDKVNPKSVYGLTKLAGEKDLERILPEAHIIIRTSWLYSKYGRNFVKTMLSLGQTKDSIKVVADQVGTPTYARDLANAVYSIISKDNNVSGIFHFSNEGVCSWYDFTKMIHKIAGISTCKVMPIISKEYPTKAVRPAFSVLDKNKIKNTFGLEIPYWVDSLEKCIAELTDIDNN